MDALEFRKRMAELPPLPPPSRPSLWDLHRQQIRYHAKTSTPYRFTRWSTIQATVTLGETDWIRKEWESLAARPDWPKWREAIEENGVGDSPRLSWDTGSSGTMVHQAYILQQWQETTGWKLEDCDAIVEFGGAYGAMVPIVRRLGFKGVYAICDLPEMGVLQEYYLTNTGYYRGVLLCDSLKEICHVVGNEPALFIAACSASEVPLAQRAQIKKVQAKSWCFLYQPEYEGIDNVAWLTAFQAKRPRQYWEGWVVPHYTNHRYLIGWEKEK